MVSFFQEQTIEGAKARAEAAFQRYPNVDFCFGIENGMYKDEREKWVDAACIFIIYNKVSFSIYFLKKILISKLKIREIMM